MTKIEYGVIAWAIITALLMAWLAVHQPPKPAPWGGGVTFQGYIDNGTRAHRPGTTLTIPRRGIRLEDTI